LAPYVASGMTAHTARVDTRPSALRCLTSIEGRLFRLSYAEIAIGSTGWMDIIIVYLEKVRYITLSN
jgi:hypothetical protein